MKYQVDLFWFLVLILLLGITFGLAVGRGLFGRGRKKGKPAAKRRRVPMKAKPVRRATTRTFSSKTGKAIRLPADNYKPEGIADIQ